ncbi:ABC transporter substrate-binding protein [Enterococcus sp. JM9B]|uniref:ABC transporter substrate-binding protein n=1 Tax=Enterococcus sp. JM9B TaxID=1857216 RepID=UPI001374A6D1|nr:extracellular solute-binding protein [Enterococcus sp. JM9B]KAF1300882.1 hypothetical protein BAU16_10905 [Enterococcus sp. JM9B]
MKKKYLLTFFLTGALLLSISACGKGSDSSKETGNGDTIEILNDKGEGTGAAKSIVPILEEQSGVNVKYVNTPDLSAYQTNIQQSLQGGQAPSLFTWWTGSQLKELVANDLIEDISDQWDAYVEAGVSDQIKDALSVDGKIYGAPLNILYNGIYYNAEIFDKYGIKEPTTFAEFLDVCEKLTQNGEVAIGLGNTWQSFCWPQALMGSLDPDLYDQWTSGEVKFTDDRVKAIFYQWADMIDKGYFSDVEQDQVKDFASGKIAMMYQATNLLTSLNQEYGMVSGENMKVFNLPTEKTDTKGTIFYEVAPLVIGKNSNNKDNAKKVLKAYFSTDVQQEYADKTGMSATTNVSFNDPISKFLTESAGDEDNFSLKLRYYEQFTPSVVNLSIDEYWKIAANPTKDQVDKSLETIQKAWEDAQ